MRQERRVKLMYLQRSSLRSRSKLVAGLPQVMGLGDKTSPPASFHTRFGLYTEFKGYHAPEARPMLLPSGLIIQPLEMP